MAAVALDTGWEQFGTAERQRRCLKARSTGTQRSWRKQGLALMDGGFTTAVNGRAFPVTESFIGRCLWGMPNDVA